jgi:hypothetical protein
MEQVTLKTTRQERYAEAIHGASGKSDDYTQEARAAMALADTEMAETLARMSADLRAVDSWADLDALRVKWGMKAAAAGSWDRSNHRHAT